MKKSKLLSGLSLLLALLMFNCNTPSNLLQEGDYDEAVYTAIKNLRKKKKKREKDIVVVEEAFRKITKRDMNQINALRADGQSINWVKINELHNNIKDRQELIEPYLPLVASKTGYKADFRFVKIVPLEIASRKKAADYYYVQGNKLMAKAEAGDKIAARSANKKFNKVKNYFDDFKKNNSLLERSYELGIDKVILEMRNSSYAIIPNGFENELLSFNERKLNEFWTVYYRGHNAPADIDYKVIVDISDIDVSPERIREEAYSVQKELFRKEKIRQEERFAADRLTATGDTVYQTRIVYKDIQVPYTVFADVIDIYQTKSAFVQARVSFYDATTKQLLNAENCSATIDFENIASTYIGDRRALQGAVCNRIGGGPVRFPSDSDLVMDAAAELKGKIAKTVRRQDSYVFR